MLTRIEAICDLLLAAAHSDTRFAEDEKQMIKTMMCALQRTEVLDPALERRIEARDPDNIDVMETASIFENDSEEDRAHVMQLITAVLRSDGEYHDDEDEFTIFAAAALGFNTTQILQYSQKLQDEALYSAFESVTGEHS